MMLCECVIGTDVLLIHAHLSDCCAQANTPAVWY